jgi:hypothetical protein
MFADHTPEELEIVEEIAKRAVDLNIHDDPIHAMMDISATHKFCPLRLADLLAADDFNFIHDVGGIRRFLNRDKLYLMSCFVPRFRDYDKE